MRRIGGLARSLQNLSWRIRYGAIPAYLHIPKTGGTYIGQREGDKNPVLYPLRYLGHAYVVTAKDERNVLYIPHDPYHAARTVITHNQIRRYFVIATVRNIYDWLVSYFGHAGGLNNKYVNTAHYDYKAARKGFGYLVRTIADRDSPWPSRKFIHFQIFSSLGDLVVDWLNRTDSLDEDLADLAVHLGVRFTKREKQRVGRTRDYREYYSDSLIEIVQQTWGRELELFGFDFDRYSADKAMIRRFIDPSVKTSVRYLWHTDQLFVNGVEFRIDATRNDCTRATQPNIGR